MCKVKFTFVDIKRMQKVLCWWCWTPNCKTKRHKCDNLSNNEENGCVEYFRYRHFAKHICHETNLCQEFENMISRNEFNFAHDSAFCRIHARWSSSKQENGTAWFALVMRLCKKVTDHIEAVNFTHEFPRHELIMKRCKNSTSHVSLYMKSVVQ